MSRKELVSVYVSAVNNRKYEKIRFETFVGFFPRNVFFPRGEKDWGVLKYRAINALSRLRPWHPLTDLGELSETLLKLLHDGTLCGVPISFLSIRIVRFGGEEVISFDYDYSEIDGEWR